MCGSSSSALLPFILQRQGGDQRLTQSSSLQVPAVGDPSCPCIPREQLSAVEDTLGSVGDSIDIEQYGVNCAAHDLDSEACKQPCDANSPLVNCERAWCGFQWCYVDPMNCDLNFAPSTFLPGSERYYSYATCRSVDVFNNDFSLLNGETIRVGLNANSGGWRGAFSDDGTQFEGPLSKWSGPAVDFLKEAASIGGLTINITEPPRFLRERSRDFFQSTSNFDLCIFAATLGFIDLCVAQYTITQARTTTSDWLVLDSEELFLIMEAELDSSRNFFGQFDRNIRTIFDPFEKNTWAFVIGIVIPLMGILFVTHEHAIVGSVFPRSEAVLEMDEFEEEPEVVERIVPWYEHGVRSMYLSFLSVLKMQYTSPVVTLGAKLHLVGFSFFILTFLAVYTANLAAILTEKQQVTTPVVDFDNAVRSGMRFCISRNSIEVVQSLHDIKDEAFVVDPEDGLPGFACAGCQPRQRVFDFMSAKRAESGDPTYCHAAITSRSNLETMQSQGLHCNKTVVGKERVGEVLNGLPVFENAAKKLLPLLLSLKNNGVYDKNLLDSRPKSVCTVELVNEGGETASLSIMQLSGIWFVSFSFAILGLVTTFCLTPCLNRWYSQCYGHRTKLIYWYDQSGHRINFQEQHDDWITKRGGCFEDEESGRIFMRNKLKSTFQTDPISNHYTDAWSALSAGRKPGEHLTVDPSRRERSLSMEKDGNKTVAPHVYNHKLPTTPRASNQMNNNNWHVNDDDWHDDDTAVMTGAFSLPVHDQQNLPSDQTCTTTSASSSKHQKNRTRRKKKKDKKKRRHKSSDH